MTDFRFTDISEHKTSLCFSQRILVRQDLNFQHKLSNQRCFFSTNIRSNENKTEQKWKKILCSVIYGLPCIWCYPLGVILTSSKTYSSWICGTTKLMRDTYIRTDGAPSYSHNGKNSSGHLIEEFKNKIRILYQQYKYPYLIISPIIVLVRKNQLYHKIWCFLPSKMSKTSFEKLVKAV